MPETNRHFELRTTLYLLLKRAFKERATIGSEQFVYYDPTNAKKNLAPDVFVKLDIPHKTFRIWKVWQRGAPEVAVEVVSDADDAEDDWNEKLERYRATGIAEVVRFDADDTKRPIRVWDHLDGDLVERLPDNGLFECVALGLYWVAVPDPDLDLVLRLARDRAGRDLLPTSAEAERAEARGRAEEARGRAEAEKTRDAFAVEIAELRRQLEQKTTSEKHAPTKTKKRAPLKR